MQTTTVTFQYAIDRVLEQCDRIAAPLLTYEMCSYNPREYWRRRREMIEAEIISILLRRADSPQDQLAVLREHAEIMALIGRFGRPGIATPWYRYALQIARGRPYVLRDGALTERLPKQPRRGARKGA